jgi:hypothetical protein
MKCILCLSAVCLIALLCAGESARADWVVLRNGTRFQGKVLSDDGDPVKVDVVAAGFRAVLTFHRGEVREIIREELPKGFFESAADPVKPGEPSRTSASTGGQRPSARTFIEVPLCGGFGTDFDEVLLKEVFRVASVQKCAGILFVIDSPGGDVGVARAMHELIRSHPEFRYFCLIKDQAYSASLWIITACDRVYFLNAGAASGAAVAFHDNPKTGAKEVDAKLNGAIAATLAAAADQKGAVPSLLVRAMVDQEVTVYGKTDPQTGRTTLAEHVPAGEEGSGWQEIDSNTQVLSLTARRAIELGFGEDWATRGEPCPPEWSPVSRAGEIAAAKSKQRCADLEKVRDWTKRLRSYVATARMTKPASAYSDYTYDYRTWYDALGNEHTTQSPTSDSLALWNGRQDQYMHAWTVVYDGARDILALVQRRRAEGLPEDIPKYESFVKDMQQEADTHLR